MKIAQLISGFPVMITNEEKIFIDRHPDRVKLPTLDERGQYIAQILVRKGIYNISKDNVTLINACNEK
jgi:hypothetical protein